VKSDNEIVISCNIFGKAHHFNAIPGRVVGNFQVTRSFCPHSVALGCCHPVTEMSTKELLAKRSVDGNVKVRMEAQHSILPLSLHDL